MLLACIKLPIVIKIFVLSIFEWPFYTGFTVSPVLEWKCNNPIFYPIVSVSVMFLWHDSSLC